MFPKKKRRSKKPKGFVRGTLGGAAFVWRKIGSLAIMAAIVAGIWFGSRHILSDFKINPWIKWTIGAAAILLLCFLIYKVWEKLGKKSGVGFFKSFRLKFAEFREEYVKGWMFYPLYVFIPWFILVGWIFQHWFPNAFSWLWNDDLLLFWTIPSILTVLVWIWVYKRFLPRAFCVVILGFLIWASISSFADSYSKTPAWIAYQARKAKKEAERELARKDLENSKVQRFQVPTGTGEWSQVVIIPAGHHFDVWPSEDCVVSFRKDGDDTQVLHYDFTKRGPERKPLDIDLGTGEHTLEFKADKPVNTNVKLISKF